MKKVNLVLTIMVAAIFILTTSCGGNGDGDTSSSSNNPLVGEWTIVKATGMSADLNQGKKYTFDSDGNVNAAGGEYKYSMSNDTLSMDFGGQGQIILTWVVAHDGDNKMTLDNASDADQKLWLEK